MLSGALAIEHISLYLFLTTLVKQDRGKSSNNRK